MSPIKIFQNYDKTLSPDLTRPKRNRPAHPQALTWTATARCVVALSVILEVQAEAGESRLQSHPQLPNEFEDYLGSRDPISIQEHPQHHRDSPCSKPIYSQIMERCKVWPKYLKAFKEHSGPFNISRGEWHIFVENFMPLFNLYVSWRGRKGTLSQGVFQPYTQFFILLS